MNEISLSYVFHVWVFDSSSLESLMTCMTRRVVNDIRKLNVRNFISQVNFSRSKFVIPLVAWHLTDVEHSNGSMYSKIATRMQISLFLSRKF